MSESFWTLGKLWPLQVSKWNIWECPRCDDHAFKIYTLTSECAADGDELQIQLTKARKVRFFELNLHYRAEQGCLSCIFSLKTIKKLFSNIEPQGETWNSALAGHELHAMDKSTDQKQLLLERFQQEV